MEPLMGCAIDRYDDVTALNQSIMPMYDPAWLVVSNDSLDGSLPVAREVVHAPRLGIPREGPGGGRLPMAVAHILVPHWQVVDGERHWGRCPARSQAVGCGA